MEAVLFWVVNQRVLVNPYRQFGTTCRSHIEAKTKKRPMCCPETSVMLYHYTLCNNPEERRARIYRGGTLKSSELNDRSVMPNFDVNFERAA